jgi:hypothetical protein
MCVDYLYILLSEIFFIFRSEQVMIINVHWSSREEPVILVRVHWNLNFLDRFSNNTQVWNYIQICPLEADLFCADRQTGRHDEANSRFCHFANAPKSKGSEITCIVYLIYEAKYAYLFHTTSDCPAAKHMRNISAWRGKFAELTYITRRLRACRTSDS